MPTHKEQEESQLGEEFVPEDDAIIGTALRWSLVAFVLLAVIAAVIWLLVHRGAEQEQETMLTVAGPEDKEMSVAIPEMPFTDVTQAAGVDFVHVNGATGERLLPETMGGGLSFFDYDSDGDQDLLLINSTHWPGQLPAGATPAHSALYANQGDWHFEDVSASSGLDLDVYGMGAAVGDIDCDGDSDLFVTAVGPNLLLRNNSGQFTPIKSVAAGEDEDWSTCATFFDGDLDGDLDLFVGNYIRWSREIDFEVDFQLTGLGRSYGPPTSFGGTYSALYRNDGRGTLEDISAEAGIQIANSATGVPVGKALGVAPVDIDMDGDIDLAVANDTVRNFLFDNRGDGTFDERGEAAFFAYDRNGKSTGAMGIDAAWYRNDETLGFAIGNFANEMTSLYTSQRGRADFFQDESIGEGIGAPSRKHLSFGLLFLDVDLDGRQDLIQANGHLESEINQVQVSQTYAQAPQLFWNSGPDSRSSFAEVSDDKLGALPLPLVGRGLACADLDGDGDLDLCLTQTGGPPRLLRNDQATGNHWLRVELIDSKACNTAGIGATVKLRAGGQEQRRSVTPTRGYLSQSELTLTFGLGSATTIDSLEVTWPDGVHQELLDLPVDTLQRVRR